MLQEDLSTVATPFILKETENAAYPTQTSASTDNTAIRIAFFNF